MLPGRRRSVGSRPLYTSRRRRCPSSTVPDRVAWAVDQLDLRPDARVLEIGGGPGAAAELVCRRLEPASCWASIVRRWRSSGRRGVTVHRRRRPARAAAGHSGRPGGPGRLVRRGVLRERQPVLDRTRRRLELDLLHRALRPGGRAAHLLRSGSGRSHRRPGDGPAPSRGLAVRPGRGAPDRPRDPRSAPPRSA